MIEPRFLLFGANGWIGSKAYKLLVAKGMQTMKASCRANDAAKVEEEINTYNPTHVMSFVGRTHGTYEGNYISTIDYLEKPGKLVENLNDNLYSPLILAEVCKRKQIHFTYLGTGCIFEYDESHLDKGFTENDLPNFFGSSYSIVKGFTDRLMHDVFSQGCLNVRIRMPITSEVNGRNFITKITNYAKVCSVNNSMTVLDELLPIIIQCALDKKEGTVNMTNPGVISHNEILAMYKEIVDPEFTWENFSIEEQNQILSSKRSNNWLDTTLLQSWYPVDDIHTAVKKVLVTMAAAAAMPDI